MRRMSRGVLADDKPNGLESPPTKPVGTLQRSASERKHADANWSRRERPGFEPIYHQNTNFPSYTPSTDLPKPSKMRHSAGANGGPFTDGASIALAHRELIHLRPPATSLVIDGASLTTSGYTCPNGD